jgi:hypothetical protein
MSQSEIENILKEGVNSCANELGWANLAELGTYLRQRGLRYGKLSRFLQDYQHIVETRIDDSIIPPAVYARLRRTQA